MKRLILTLAAGTLLTLWAGAQSSPPPVLAADRLRLLHANRGLLEDLLDRGLKLGDASGKLDRAEECRLALGTLTDALNRATEEPAIDADRVAELTDHLTELVQSGLAPTLAEARAKVNIGSPGKEQLDRIVAAATTDLTAVQNQFLLDPRLARSAKLKTCHERLRDAVGKITPKE